MTDAPEPQLVTRLRARRDAYERWPRVAKYGFLALGFLVLLAGIAMLALPGPAFVVIPVGLLMLSFEFKWAERLLEKAIEKGAEAQRRAAQTTRRQRVLGALAGAVGVAVAGTAAAVVLL